MATEDSKAGRERRVEIRAQFPKGVSDEEKRAMLEETENEIIDSLSGDQAVSFLKAKAKETTEIAVEVATEKTKTIF
jgi:hypothetical protein